MLGRLDETLRFCLDNNCFKLCFMNPLVLIESDEPTSKFLEAIQIWRNRWCPQFKRLYGKPLARSRNKWLTDLSERSDEERLVMRSLCFTGALINVTYDDQERYLLRRAVDLDVGHHGKVKLYSNYVITEQMLMKSAEYRAIKCMVSKRRHAKSVPTAISCKSRS